MCFLYSDLLTIFFFQIRVRRQSMEQLDLIKITPDGKRAQSQEDKQRATKSNKNKAQDDDFFEFLSRTQSKRMDDQRCSIKIPTNIGPVGATRKPLVQQNSLSSAGSSDLSNITSGSNVQLPGLKNSSGHGHLQRAATTTSQPDDAFLDMLMRCQGSRLEEQRSELPKPNVIMDAEAAGVGENGVSTNVAGTSAVAGRTNAGSAGGVSTAAMGGAAGGTTVPDEDFFSLIMKVQSGRMEDQRAAIPFGGFNRNNNTTSTSNGSNK